MIVKYDGKVILEFYGESGNYDFKVLSNSNNESDFEFDKTKLSFEASSDSEIRQQKKQQLMEMTVEVDGMVFDANESSRANIQSALTVGQLTNQTETQWILADNSVSTVTEQQLKQVLTLAMQQVSVILTSD